MLTTVFCVELSRVVDTIYCKTLYVRVPFISRISRA